MSQNVRALLAAFSLLLAGDLPSWAGTTSLELGRGIFHYQYPEALFLRYRMPAFGHSEDDAYFEAMAGAWNGGNRNEIAAISLGLFFSKHNTNRFFASMGAGRVSRETRNLGTKFQFTYHLGYSLRFDSFGISFGYIHISNGKLLFGWDGPDVGQNFLTIQFDWL